VHDSPLELWHKLDLSTNVQHEEVCDKS